MVSMLLWMCACSLPIYGCKTHAIATDDKCTIEHFEELSAYALKRGMNSRLKSDLNKTLACLARNGDTATQELVERMHSVNVRVAAQQNLDYSAEDEHDQMFLTFAIATLYPTSSGIMKKQILGTIEESLHRDIRAKEEALPGFWSLFLIGADSVSVLIDLSESPNKVVACEARESLTVIAKNNGGPDVSCEASDDPQAAISKWKDWWSNNKGRITFPKISSPWEESDIASEQPSG
jgi:hypothetical protein